MTELFAVITITLLAVISPGADFAMISRNSLLYGKRAGLAAALGIGLGVQVHVMYTLLGASLLQQTPLLLQLLRVLGAGYLVYVGWCTFRSGAVNEAAAPDSHGRALRNGFLTNALNPKTMLFVISTYTQVVAASTPLPVLLGYGLFMSLAHVLWFALVAVLLAQDGLRQRLLGMQLWLNRGIGLLLMALGSLLAAGPLLQ
ncbi:LysE family translocator [Vogesella indigofera]|uniref:LysE family transporter n=1 Tax=Vogesella indigofera TaxID=45465 RepID=A0ABT5I4F2_VOGIN|nr:LysE family transporter [Vogesella indigofera]MDC7691057.1 LysE family transporter [Vogesella indigofera]